MTRRETLEAAIEIVTKDRNETHGEPEDSFQRIAVLWSGLIGYKFSRKEVCMMMIALKMARAAESSHPDNYIDIAGYAACAAEIDT